MAEYQLHLGDCLDVMPTLEAGSVDAVICDLPYGVTSCAWDSVIPLAPLWAEYKRLLKPRGAVVLTASQPFTSVLVMSNPRWFRCEWIWSKNTGGHPGLLRTQPSRTHESILVFAAHPPTYNPQRQLSRSQEAIRNAQRGATRRRTGSKSNHINMHMQDGKWSEYVLPTSVQYFASVPRATGSLHPTQKPVALGEYLIRTYTNPGDLVLDNTTGVASFGVAALNTGRRFIGIERDEGYYATAVERMSDAARQGRLELERVS